MMPISDSNDINTVLRWDMDKPDPYHDPVFDQEATEAARRLAAKAYKALAAGLRPDDVQLSRRATVEAHQRTLTIWDIGPAAT